MGRKRQFSDDSGDSSFEDEQAVVVAKPTRKPNNTKRSKNDDADRDKSAKPPYPDQINPLFAKVNHFRLFERELWTSRESSLWRKQVYVSRLNRYRIFRNAAFFDRRVTCIEWHPHPKHNHIVAVASKGGDIMWWDSSSSKATHKGYSFHVEAARRRRERNNDSSDDEDGLPPEVPFIYGSGKGGSITAMKFHPELSNFVFTSSIEGCIKRQDFEGRASAFFLDTMSRESWWTALDISHRSLIVGKTNGEVVSTNFDGNVLWRGRLHKNGTKVQHIEVHPIKHYIFATAGNDKLVKIWDARMLRLQGEGGAEPLQIMPHDGNLNSATFSPVAPYTLLTTSQDSQLRIYASDDPSTMPKPVQVLRHPHRSFQHITAIQGYWHPSASGVFAIDAHGTGSTDIVARMEDSRVSQIHVIAKFNHSGDILASASGFTTHLWRYGDDYEAVSSIESIDVDHHNDGGDDDANGGRGGKKKRKGGVGKGKKQDYGRSNKKNAAT
ncbi:hypothetical protein SeMB42_g01764 [Synchytrium endobioticum]|uniref:Anaphase-promoting complex subunit 4-like WD40 domain-containing protein n=1 Tax=Synchytrium endobioticum TaxID=286115 RepID=A0A507DM18_9FUNG|nr:hypothetical protein SeLEV6574_g02197 [Synchytrium endobioticum]TPX51928.1 hypothetical protein SeMB42_g01764 [Synchytrium endobioticum]